MEGPTRKPGKSPELAYLCGFAFQQFRLVYSTPAGIGVSLGRKAFLGTPVGVKVVAWTIATVVSTSHPVFSVQYSYPRSTVAHLNSIT